MIEYVAAYVAVFHALLVIHEIEISLTMFRINLYKIIIT